MEGKIKLPIVKNGYDVEAADAYINMLQSEYNRVCEWGSNLEEKVEALSAKGDSTEQIDALKQQNRSLYNNCVAFAKHIKRLEKLRTEQGTFYVEELAATENKKKSLEQEIVILEERKNFLEASSESAKGQAEAIVGAANLQAEKIIANAQAEAEKITRQAESEATEMLKSHKDRIENVISQLNGI